MSNKEVNKEVIVNNSEDETDKLEAEDETQRQAKEKEIMKQLRLKLKLQKEE